MSTKFIDFKNPKNDLENCEIIMLDTCTLINLATGDKSTLDFAKFTLNNDIMLCYSSKTEEELQIIQESKYIPKNKRVANLNMNNYLQESYNSTDSILNVVHALPNMFPNSIEFSGEGLNKISRENALAHNLRWGDAVIYTIAKNNDIKYIWSHDKDWTSVKDDEMTIITEGRFIPNNNISLIDLQECATEENKDE